jgi:hypothetical protein
MLSSVLGSPRAVAVIIEIMRTFVRRALAATNGELAKRLNELERKTEALALEHDTLAHNTRSQLRQVFDAIRQLMTPPDLRNGPLDSSLRTASGVGSSFVAVSGLLGSKARLASAPSRPAFP